MDKFTVTGYAKATDTATVTLVVDGTTYNGVKIQGIPHDSVANVKAFFRAYVDAFKAGKATESAAQADISAEVKALLNVATEF